jgi:hypothetical protein
VRANRSRNIGASHAASGSIVCTMVNGRRIAPIASHSQVSRRARRCGADSSKPDGCGWFIAQPPCAPVAATKLLQADAGAEQNCILAKRRAARHDLYQPGGKVGRLIIVIGLPD